MEERGPIEAGLGWCCKEDTGFIGAEAVRAVREAGPREKLVPFTLTGAGIARQGNPVVGGGEVTSGTLSPCLERRHRHGLRARRARRSRAPSSRSTCAARSAPPWWPPSRSTARRTMADASYPDDLLYHPEHDWVRIDGDTATFGITWFAQDALGEVVFFDPPEVGSTVTQGRALRRGRVGQGGLRRHRAAVRRDRRGQHGAGRQARGHQRRPLRRRLAGQGQALGPSREGRPARRGRVHRRA